MAKSKDPLAKMMKKEKKKEKQELKTEKNLKKQQKRELALEEDIQSQIQRAEEETKKVKKAILQVCDPPSPRVGISLVLAPSGELVLFGGEYFDGANQYVYNETFRWNMEKKEWRQVYSPVTPKPRCAHQCVVYKNHMYMFGGEYSTLSQFHHYRDFWRLDLKSNVWEELQCSGSLPTQRSGHRMSVWRNYIVLFGGFYDTFRDCKYFNDLYLFDVTERRWTKIELIPTSPVPAPRGGCCLAVHAATDTLFVYGGYSREAKQNATSGTEHNDMWSLNLKATKFTWERVSKKGTAPSSRAGASMVVHKNRALIFGGVKDKDMPGLTMDSTFYNELYAFDMDRRRWYTLEYKAPKKVKKRRAKDVHSVTTAAHDVAFYDDDDYDEDVPCFAWTFEYYDEHGELVQMTIPNDDPTENREKADAAETEDNVDVEDTSASPPRSPTPVTPLTECTSAPEVVGGGNEIEMPPRTD